VKKLMLLAFVIFLSGCGAMLASKNTDAMMKLNIGDSKEVVASVMGAPRSKETFKGKEYWIYRTNGCES